MKEGGLLAPFEFQGNDEVELGLSSQSLLRDSQFERDDVGTVGWIDAWYEDGERRKVNLDRTWYRNIEFFEGNQWVQWSEEEQRHAPARAPKWRVRYTGNLCSVFTVTKASKILQQRPRIYVRPATGSPEDERTAHVSQKILRYFWAWQGHQHKTLPEFCYWLVLTGLGTLKWGFDPIAGPLREIPEEHDHLVDPEDAERVFGARERQQGEVRSFALGEPFVEPVSPFNLYPDPSAQRWEDLGWLLDVRRKSLDFFYDRWGPRGALVSSEGTHDRRDFYEMRIRDVTGYRNFLADSQPGAPSALMKELWVRPCRRYPQGYHVIVAGQVVLERGPLPKWCRGRLPYAMARDKPTPGKLWPDATFNDLVGPQKLRNRAVSLVIENGNKIGSPAILLPAQCRVNQTDFTGGPGNIISYFGAGGLKPELMQHGTLPDYVKNMPEMFEADIMLISGMNEPTFAARSPRGVRTASGLAQLQESDNSRQVVLIEGVNGTLGEAFSGFLAVAAEEVVEERLATIADEDRIDLLRWSGKDLAGKFTDTPGVNYFNVECRVDSGYKSRSATQEFLLSLATAGIIRIDNDEERRWLVRELRIGDDDDAIFGQVLGKEQQARLENILIGYTEEQFWMMPEIQGKLGPWEWDDDEVHIMAHEEFMRRPQFLEVAAKNPAVVARFQTHIREHRMNLQMKMLQQAAMQMGAPVGGPMGGPMNGQGPPPLEPGQKHPGDPGVARARLKQGSRKGQAEPPRGAISPGLDRQIPK